MSFLNRFLGRFGGIHLLPTQEEYDNNALKNEQVLTELNARLDALAVEAANQGRLRDYPKGQDFGNKHN